ncbi:MAG: CusA/CzcA family heavy metal efflux RND transporter [Lentisphaeria bacterium]|nr:CusA/CzcA family heavy metal efflux RND transporter [Lentisphaeria bacterium]
MINKVITWSLEHRLVVIVLALVLVSTGILSVRNLPIDAFPDTTPAQVQINTTAPALSPLEIEQQITFPVEQAISGLPGLEVVRSISKFGFSQVTVVFEDGTDIYFARQLIMERLQTVELPSGIAAPEMGPVATGLGEVFHYVLSSQTMSLEELTTLHDWVIKPRLSAVPGVAEVNTWGGELRQYHVLVDVAALLKYDLTMDDLFVALERNNLTVGGGNIVQAGELHLVRGISLTTTKAEIGNIVITAHDGVPVLVRDVAEVTIGHEIRRGSATANGQGEVVLGLGFMLMGENSHEITRRLQSRLEAIRPTLPEAVEIKIVYQRTTLVNQVIDTVKENLFEGAILVVAVLFMFLGSLRAGLIVALAIPLSMLCAFNGMLRFGVAGSLMSLGAIDFGLIVDSSVIMVENSVRRLGDRDDQRPVLDIVRDASIEVRRATMFGELIIMIVYLPILTLEGIEGKLFRPMALTVIFALIGSLVLSLTLMPVLTSIFLRKGVKKRQNWLVRSAQWCYRPLLRRALRWRLGFVGGAIILLIGSIVLSQRLGSEFVPRLSEMGIVINTVRLAGVSLEESTRYGSHLEHFILDKFPDEVDDVWVRTGTAAVATDPMGIELSDVFITLTPRDQWTRAHNQTELTAIMRRDLDGLPGMRMIFTQPIEMRVNEMIAGIRSDLGIKLFGDDLDVLGEKAAEVEAVLKTIPGAADIYTEQVTGQPSLEITVDQQAIARHGVPARHVLEIVEAIGTRKVGEVREDQRRFDLVVRLAEPYRQDAVAIGRILVPTESGERIPLDQLADIRHVEGPSTITREWQRRRIVIQCNVSDRDIGGFVEEVQRRLAVDVALPNGYYLAYGGQFENIERAQQRLLIVVPLALALILFLLYTSMGTVRDSLIIFTGAPFAAMGGILALWLRDMPFTISAGVGFVAVSGVAMLNGLVMMSTINQLQEKGMPLNEAIEKSALMRLRPVLMTALVAGLGFVPMALNTGVGAEVQRPLATVVIGGVITDNLLTLLVLPALCSLFGRKTSLVVDAKRASEPKLAGVSGAAQD